MSVENLADLNQGLAVIPTLVGRVDVLDDLAEVVRHPLELSVQGLGQRVDPLALGVWRWSSRQRLLQRSEDLLELRLLAGDEVQLVLQTLEAKSSDQNTKKAKLEV